MIKKFQQGGQQQQQLDQIFAMINQQPEEALKQLVQSGAKPEDIAKIVQVGVQQGKINPEVGNAVMQALQGQVSAARHGMKLQYIKSLKHQCADDEELYYYKVGGKVDCGCKKKGGNIKPEKECGGGAVSKFKAMKMQKAGKIRTKAEQDKINKQSEEDYFNGTADHTKPGEPQKPVQKFKTRTKAEQDRINKQSEKDYFNGTSDHTKPGTRREEPFEPNPRPRPRSKSTTTIKRDTSRFIKTQLQKTGGSVVEKFKSARCGSKMKKK